MSAALLVDSDGDVRRPWSGRYAQERTAACLAYWGTQCHLCPDPTPATTADHLIPRSRGGSDALENLRPAHRACNSRRGARLLDLTAPVVTDGRNYL